MTRKSDRPVPAEDGERLWQRVASTVTPLAPRRMPVPPPLAVQTAPTNRPRSASGTAPTPLPSPAPRPQSAPSDLDPRRHRRVSREREPIEARLDLHGHGRFQAEDVLTGFLLRAHQRGLRVVLVITGHGRRAGGGEGVIRASLPEWLRSHALRGVVAAYAPAHRRHGGEGAWYITLKRG
jgi:DNA-nicking Smr family endonuclease